MAIEILRAEPAHARLIREAAPEVFDGPPDSAHLEAALADPNLLLMLAVGEGIVVGQALGRLNRRLEGPPEIHLDNFGVTPRLHRRGIGRKLTAALAAEGLRLGAGGFWVAAEPENDLALAFYRALALEESGATVFAGDCATLAATL